MCQCKPAPTVCKPLKPTCCPPVQPKLVRTSPVCGECATDYVYSDGSSKRVYH